MKRQFVLAIALAASVLPLAAAEDRVTAREAEAMVRKGVAHIKATPRDKAMADITDKKGMFVDRELYLTVYTPDGTALARERSSDLIVCGGIYKPV